jgi:cytochrome P450
MNSDDEIANIMERLPYLNAIINETLRLYPTVPVTGKPNNMGGAASNYDYLTFLHGPRSCIGQGFAKAELRCMVAAMVRKFEWDLDMDQKDVIPGGAITIKPMKGLHVKLRVAP